MQQLIILFEIQEKYDVNKIMFIYFGPRQLDITKWMEVSYH